MIAIVNVFIIQNVKYSLITVSKEHKRQSICIVDGPEGALVPGLNIVINLLSSYILPRSLLLKTVYFEDEYLLNIYFQIVL